MTRSMPHKYRASIRVSTLALAAALAAGPSPAAAQSFQGSATPVGGTASVDQGTPGQTIVTVNQSQAVIDWAPFPDEGASGTAIDFQPAGTTATFQNNPDLVTDFAVLNRINVTDNSRMVGLNGTINSLVNGQTGGSIYFYSPSGFIVGSSAVINVGSLVLSASPITVTGGSFIDDGKVEFGQALNVKAAIMTNAGSQISALNEGSYVALVAPRVEHHGNISVNGGAALVGAEAATITFRTSGLFDIAVDVGTTDANGVSVDGTITGPASTGGTDFHRAYLVAVPKNTALTMLIGSGADLGFALAGSAAIDDNGAVVLSVGRDIAGGDMAGQSAAAGAVANIRLSDAHVTSNLLGSATGSADLFATAGASTAFDSDVTFAAVGQLAMYATGAGATLNVAGDLNLSTDAVATIEGASATGGDTSLFASSGGNVTIGGSATLSANGVGGDGFSAGVDGGNGQGGDASISADGGTLLIRGNAVITVDGRGGHSESGTGGTGTGGLGQMFATNGADVTIGGFASISTSGQGGNGLIGGDGIGGGGLGEGGAYFSSSLGGSLTITGFAELTAQGQGGFAFGADGAGGNGGIGRGGHTEAYANGATLMFDSELYFNATGRGGSAGAAGVTTGAGFGGDVYLQAVAGGTVSVGQDPAEFAVTAYAAGLGGDTDFGVNSGNGTGGTITTHSRGGDSTLTIDGGAYLDADGQAGEGGECSFNCGAIGGVGRGGTIIVSAITGTGNTLGVSGALEASAEGGGGEGVTGAGGDGFGGLVQLHVAGGNLVNVAGDVTLEATGEGGFDSGGFVAGDGVGGIAQITTADSSANLLTLGGNVTIDASGLGGDSGELASGAGGDGTGGRAGMYNNGGTVTVAGSVTVLGEGYGGNSDGPAGVGGDGFGKTAEIFSVGGDTTIDGSAFIDASGLGGYGFVGGDGTGGGDSVLRVDGAHIVARNGDISIGLDGVEASANVVSNGYGGFGIFGGLGGGSGGDGTGGWVTVHSANSDLGPSSITSPFMFVSAAGEGGGGGEGGTGSRGGDGGIGTGGVAILTAGAGNGLLEIFEADIDVTGQGGDGGDGGSADGGPAGNGGNGGAALGGFANVGTESGAPSVAQAGVANFNSITADASATGGQGGDGGVFGAPNGDGGNGGSAEGGTVDLVVRGSTANVNSVELIANATGGNGGIGVIAGAGGDAESDEVGVLVTERDENPAVRGQLNAGTITGNVSAVGGSGSVAGASFAEGGSFFIVRNADAAIGSVDISIAADSLLPDLAEDAISVVGGEVTVEGDFSFTTAGHLSLFVDNGSMTADNLILAASDMVPDTVNVTPTAGGTYFANTISIATDNNIHTTAHVDSATGLDLTAPGSVTTGNVNGNGFDVLVEAQGGSIDVGDIDGADVVLTAAGDLSVGSINADAIDASAGGTATLAGVWSASLIDLWSDDIDVAVDGGIDAGVDGSITLVSTHEDGALIGDGLTGSGYALSNAEFGRISGGDLTIVVGGLPGSGADTLIGDLTITGPDAGSTIESETGGVTFITTAGGEGLDGTLRIAGNVVATGFGGDNYLEFLTENFELDAATGSLSIEGAPGTLSGQLFIEADHIHVASGDILDRLAEDPQYDGYREDLNAPAEVQRPEGVIRAGSIEVEFGDAELNTLYVQNSGTSETPAGFLVTDAVLFGDDGEAIPEPASIDVVINGQIVTEGGTLTGVDVRDALVEAEGDLTPFTANSMVNGCLLAGPCGAPPPPPGPLFPPGFTATPGIQHEVELIDDGLLPPPLFGNEDFIDDNDDTTLDGVTSPIEPPQPLFDTSGLGAKSDVDDPVSGSGNPALMETAPEPPANKEQQP